MVLTDDDDSTDSRDSLDDDKWELDVSVWGCGGRSAGGLGGRCGCVQAAAGQGAPAW